MPDDLEFVDFSKFKKKKAIPPYPFVGVVGQQEMKKALLLLAANPRIGSLLILGENGTGKATAASAVQQILPKIEVVSGCSSNCDPVSIGNSCKGCLERLKSEKLETTTIPTPFIRLPVGTSDHRIFGDFEKSGTFVPGILSTVNRGYLLIDRINLQDPLKFLRILDIQKEGVHVMSMGKHTYSHPAEFTLIATANPAESQLHKNIMAAFHMVIQVSAIHDVEERIEIVRRVESYKEDPFEFLERSKREQDIVRNAMENARRLLKRSEIPKKTQAAIYSVLKEAGVEEEGIRDAIMEAAKANAAIEDRPWATVEDVSEIVDLVLGFR